MWVNAKVKEDTEVKLVLLVYTNMTYLRSEPGQHQEFWQDTLFWCICSSHSVDCSEFLRRKINQRCLPAADLHAEGVGVAVKCSFPPTNACINLTHSYYTLLFCHVCSVAEKKLNAMQISWNILPGICIHFRAPHLLLQSFRCTCVLHINDHTKHLLFLFCVALVCIDFAAEICFWPSMQLSNTCWIITQRLDAYKLFVLLFFSPGALQLSASPLNDQSILCC